MDKFREVVTKNKMSIQKRQPLPNRPSYSDFEISFDKYQEFINWYLSSKIELPLLHANIYDEDIISNSNEIHLRIQILRILNSLIFRDINFYLSDTTLPIYNKIMSEIGWKHAGKTTLNLRIDRNPKERKNLELPLAQGKLNIKEENLIWLPLPIIKNLNCKIDDDTLKKAIKLKEIVNAYYMRLNNLYHINELSEFDKIWLAYDFIKRHITFANCATRYENGKQVLYNPNNIFDWVSEPLGTYQHKQGVCEGQSRLAQALLNNPYLRSDTSIINGTCPLGNHVWIGSVVNNKLYQTCLTTAKPFKKLETEGYIPDTSEIYPRVYNTASLTDADLAIVRSHIKKFKK